MANAPRDANRVTTLLATSNADGTTPLIIWGNPTTHALFTEITAFSHGKTPKFKTGSASATFTIVAAVATKKIKVNSLSLMTASETPVTITFKDGAGGTVIATYILQAIAATNFGITENLPIPSELFETSAGVLLEMSFSASVTVVYNLRYFDDDST